MNDVVALFIFFLWYLLFFLIHVCVVCVIFSFMFFRYGLFLSFIFRWIHHNHVFLFSADYCYLCCVHDEYWCVLLPWRYKIFLWDFSFSRIFIKIRITCLSEGLISFALDRHFRHFPFVHVDLMSKAMEARARKSVLLPSLGNVSSEGLVENILLHPSWGEAGLASPSLALIFPLELGTKADFRCSRLSLTREVRRLNLWGQSKRFPGVKVS